ncbi:MAG: hypothetical protein Q8P50_06615 [Bacillota bacterium]|nr:hypothetical protein [Bacillota bacterium]
MFFPSDALPFQVAFGCLLAIVALDELLRKGGRRWSRETWAALALPALYGLSFLFAVDRHQALAESLKYLNYFAVLFIAARLASPSRPRWMAYTLLVSAAGVEAIGLLGALGLGRFPGVMSSGSLQSTFGYRNALGGYLLAVFATGNALVASRPGLVSVAIAALNYLTTLSIVTTYSRGT